MTFAIVLGVIIYRISTAAALAMNSSPSVRSNIRVTVTATAVIINLVVIILLDEVYGCVARWLTTIGQCPCRCPGTGIPSWTLSSLRGLRLSPRWLTRPVPTEVPKTEKSFEERLIFKAFLLKFVNSYTPIFYVAFFKGRYGCALVPLPGGLVPWLPEWGGASGKETLGHREPQEGALLVSGPQDGALPVTNAQQGSTLSHWDFTREHSPSLEPRREFSPRRENSQSLGPQERSTINLWGPTREHSWSLGP